MAGSVNKVILVGNLGQDPEVKSFQNGGRIANLRIATSESWKDRQTGERKERTEWHTVVLQSDGLVGVAERYLRKGSKVYIEGQLRTPQMLYFLNRMRAEFGRPRLPHRSFMPELSRSAQERVF